MFLVFFFEVDRDHHPLHVLSPSFPPRRSSVRVPLSLLFPGGDPVLANRLYERSPYSRAVQRLAAEVMAALPRGRPLSVLEVGAGTGATTAHLLDALPPGSRNVFTDLGASLVARAEERSAGPAIGLARRALCPIGRAAVRERGCQYR